MSLFKKMFGDKAAPQSQPRSSAHRDSDTADSGTASRGASRREVVHVVLHETLRRHGIPSDWIECRTMNLVQPNKSTGTYITLIVHGGHVQLMPYVLAFQASFKEAIDRFDPRASDWLRGLAWQFDNAPASASQLPSMPGPGVFVREPVAAAPVPAASAADSSEEDDLQKDLEALFAIRDAALSRKSKDAPPDFQATRPG